MENYKVVDGIIVSPGKFEGEPEWVVTLWEMVLNGMADESVHDGTMVIDAFKLDAEMARITGLEPSREHYVCLWSSDQGFVSHKVLTETQLFECEGFVVTEPWSPWDTREDWNVV